MNTWQANLTTDNQSLEIVAARDSTVYRRTILDLERLTFRWWTDGTHEYAALYDRNVNGAALIEVCNNSTSAHFNNQILGSSDPSAIKTAWSNLSIAASGSSAAVSSAATTSGIQASQLIIKIADALGLLADSAYDGSADRGLVGLFKGIFNKILTVTQITAAVNDSTKLGDIDNKLASIVVNTATVRYKFSLANDDSQTFIVRYDAQTGTVANFDLQGASYTPIGTFRTESKNNVTVQTQEYQAKTTSAGNWTVDDRIVKVEAFDFTSNSLVSKFWINDSTDTVLTIAPVPGVDLTEADAASFAQLKAIATGLGAPNDLPAVDDVGQFGLVPLFKRLLTKLPTTLAQNWKVQLTDGLNVAIIKPALEPASSTDQSLVVALSPNSIGKFNIDQTTDGTTNKVAANLFVGGGAYAVGAKTIANSIAFNLASDQTPTTLAQNWKVQLTDGTNVMPTGDAIGRAVFNRVTDGINEIKIAPASTTPTATDPSLVVALSPNSVTKLASNASELDIASAAISLATTSAPIAPTFGISYAIDYTISAMGASTVYVEIQESINGTTWQTIYNFSATASGSYKSPLIGFNGGLLRYVEIPTGGSVTRTIRRLQSNAPTDYVPTLRYGGYNLNSIALAQMARFKTISISNNSGTLLWLQLFDKALALAGGDVPINGCVYRIPANSTISYGVGDFGADGKFVGVNPRLGISSTFASYTAATLTATAINVEARV